MQGLFDELRRSIVAVFEQFSKLFSDVTFDREALRDTEPDDCVADNVGDGVYEFVSVVAVRDRLNALPVTVLLRT
jgi:hypothetical protein